MIGKTLLHYEITAKIREGGMGIVYKAKDSHLDRFVAIKVLPPEQAEGKRVDARSDIFSFGSVLYEMVTGRKAFQKDFKTSTLAAIINQEPAPFELEIPHDLEKIIKRCLQKDTARRYQHMDDLKIALQELKEESESGKLGAPQTAGAVPLSKRIARRASVINWITAISSVSDTRVKNSFTTA